MRINGEPVELVTDFAQLRAGMIVWVKPCLRCQLAHRQILTRLVNAGHRGFLEPDGRVATNESGWYHGPQPRCCPFKSVIAEDAIPQRRVYRVIDRALDAQTTERKREMVRP